MHPGMDATGGSAMVQPANMAQHVLHFILLFTFFVCFIILPTMLPNHMTFINEVTQLMVSHNNPPFFKKIPVICSD